MTSLAQKNMAQGQLITNEILDPQILAAMAEIPREEFVPELLRGAAYVDHDLPVGGGRYLQAPLTFAKLLAHAGITPQCRVLNIGAVTGYTAAVIAKLAAHVVAVEVGAAAAQLVRDNLARFNFKNIDIESVNVLQDGYALSAPYNVIILSGGVRTIPEALQSQLAVHGRLSAVRLIAARADAQGGTGRGIVIRREHDHFYTSEHFDAPTILLPGFE
jgi:protein-L-isoaspartate(D-aspartate) O-methyltransferase